jgi:hypothetical protein
MANTGKSEMTALEKKEYDALVERLSRMKSAQRKLTMLSAIEASVLLRISIGTLDRARSKRRALLQAGQPIDPDSHAAIPCCRPGDDGPARYFAQDVAKFLKRSRNASKALKAPKGSETISTDIQLDGIRCWMTTASAVDTWPFSIQLDGRPIDLMDALSLGQLTGEACRLTLRDFATQLALTAAKEFHAAEAVAIMEESDGPFKGAASKTSQPKRRVNGSL